MEYKSLHIRVDIATKSKVHDNKKSVFLGGLPFGNCSFLYFLIEAKFNFLIDCSDEDVYSHFSPCGPIEFVRLIRDNKTGIGKGFGYVQFKTTDSVSLAVRLNGSTINERKIRVERCVKKQKENKTETRNLKKTSKKGNGTKEHERKDKSEKNPGKMNEKNSDKSKLSKEERSKAYKLGKIKRRKFIKKKHVSTNKNNKTKFKI